MAAACERLATRPGWPLAALRRAAGAHGADVPHGAAVHPAAGQGVPGRRSPSCPTRRRSSAPSGDAQDDEIALDASGVGTRCSSPALGATGSSTRRTQGIVFVMLERSRSARAAELAGPAMAQALNAKFAGIQEAFVAVFPPPPVEGLGTAGGFKISAGSERPGRAPAVRRIRRRWSRRPTSSRSCAGCSPASARTCRSSTIDIDRERAKRQGVSVRRVFNTLQVYLGSLYVNDFNRFGRTWQVIVQADAAVPRARWRTSAT